jgi:glutamine synthetase
MHLHVSLVEGSGQNVFADRDGNDSHLFRWFVGGLQTYLPQIAPLFAPTVNSFRRLRPSDDAPINMQWGSDNRSCGLRVPLDDAQNRRIENRLPGADANPYLAISAALIAGWLGIEERREPTPRAEGNAYRHARTLPKSLEAAMDRMSECTPVLALLGERFFAAFSAIKQSELNHYQHVVSSWERDHLLLKA